MHQQKTRIEWLDIAKGLSIILVVVFVVLLPLAGWRRALGVCIVTGAGWLTTLVVKFVVAQPRPTTGDLTHLLHVSPATLSYPSGHVVFVTALVAALATVCRTSMSRAVVLDVGGVLVVAVAWSRLYVGVHYGTDVVGGVLNGAAGAVLVVGLWDLATRRLRPGRAS